MDGWMGLDAPVCWLFTGLPTSLYPSRSRFPFPALDSFTFSFRFLLGLVFAALLTSPLSLTSPRFLLLLFSFIFAFLSPLYRERSGFEIRLSRLMRGSEMESMNERTTKSLFYLRMI